MPDSTTPMMRQFQRVKSQLPDDTLLFFRVGDFYELFFDDAKRAAPILGVALTSRGGAPLCGVPYHALDTYLAKAIRAGKKVAICDQTEDPALAKGIVRREVTRVVTPGTITEDAILEASANNFLAAVFFGAKPPFGLALLDISTGAFSVQSCATPDALRDALRQAAPAEILLPASLNPETNPSLFTLHLSPPTVTTVEDWTFGYDAAYTRLTSHFHLHSLQGLGCEGRPELVCPAGALLHYAAETLQHNAQHIRPPQVRNASETLVLDPATCQHLDILPQRGRPAHTSLLGILDQTKTPMGARLLRHWLLNPLRQLNPLNERLDAVQHLVQNRALLSAVQGLLPAIRDLERLLTRISANRANGRDLRSLANSLEPLPRLKELCGGTNVQFSTGNFQQGSTPSGNFQCSTGNVQQGIKNTKQIPVEYSLLKIENSITSFPELTSLLLSALVETPPLTVKEGGLIRPGYSAELDQLLALSAEGHSWVATYQQQQQEATGIKTLKVRHNNVHGFYIEISKGQSHLAPANYQRRQTLVNAERYTTPELNEYEHKIMGAQDKAGALQYEIFCGLRDRVLAQLDAIQTTAAAVAQLDVLATFAQRALDLHYTRPELHEGDALTITNGRHPVVEQLPGAEPFIPNDSRLDNTRHQILLITGPNMAGKSTYIRQVALIAILAHAGSFVPADAALIPLLDRVFTRVGAGDDLAQGRSTFMVEMQETAGILNNATPRSLLVLDEIGRGTSTFDGISIAWAVAEHLHNTPECKAKTLFATHYHELTDLALTLPGVRNYTVQIHERGQDITFLRKIIPGAADKSYGLHVARLAGLPPPVVARAREILANLEDDELNPTSGMPTLARRNKKAPNAAQPELF